MISNELLQSFCCESQSSISKPVTHESFTYATNRVIAIRVPKIDTYEEVADTHIIISLKDIFNKYSEFSVENYKEFSNYIDNTEEKIKCDKCNGTGKISECPDCEGSGTVYWTSEHKYEYDANCQMCDGTGSVSGNDEECEECDGLGYTIKRQIIKIGSKYLDNGILTNINKLPNCKIATEVTEGLKPVPIIFDGGIGLVMPCRIEEKGKI